MFVIVIMSNMASVAANDFIGLFIFVSLITSSILSYLFVLFIYFLLISFFMFRVYIPFFVFILFIVTFLFILL